MKHTTGPWNFSSGMVWAGNGEEIAIARAARDEMKTYPTERDANARLCAAAPEMLEALQATLPALIRLGDFIGNVHDGSGASGIPPFDRCAIIAKVRDAIDKAMGKE